MKTNRKTNRLFYVVLFAGCLLFFSGIFCRQESSVAQAADTISREEWVHVLAETFQMKIEDGLMPDGYYVDVSPSTSTYYQDIMTAVNFGVIDLDAGEEFHPKEAVTREFAAQTLNFCLGFELEENAPYTMTDYESLKYAVEDQIAVNHGWIALINNEFCPDKAITLEEKNQMIADAKQVLETAKIDEKHENTYEFAENVIVFPEGTEVELGENKVTIYGDTGMELSKGDIFAVFSNGIAYTYRAVELSSETGRLEVETQDADYNNTVTKYDAEGIIEADLGTFVPASDDIVMDVEYEETEEGIVSHADTRAKKNIKDIKLSTNVGGGKVTCNITKIQVNYKLNGGDYLFSVSGKATASYTISGKKNLTIPIGYVNIAGVGKIEVNMVYSADGTAALTLSSKFAAGIERTNGNIRKIKNFTTPSWHFSAQAELRAACKVSFEIAIPAIADGNVYAEIGVKSTPDIEVYSDGKKPTICMDFPAYLYATAGYSVNVIGHQVAKETIPIYTASNSPIKVCYHIEDGKRVSVCGRLDSSSRVGKRGYYSLADASGTYGSECFVAPVEEVKIFDYELDDAGHATITKYYGNVYALTIPDELDGYPVTAIGEGAFKGNVSLGSVVIPNGVERIGKEAFSGCTTLADVVLPENSKYTFIEESVFAEDISLNCIEIPKYVTEIRKRAFYHCGWSVLHLSEDITYIGSEAFYGCAKLYDLVLPKFMERYGAACFGDCDSLQSVEIYRYLKENDYYPDYHAMVDNDVMRGMFYGCDNLKEVRFARGVTEIAHNLFNGCTGLEEITLPDTVTYIGFHAFNACTSLRKINLPDLLTKIDVMAFRNCTSLEHVDLPDSVTEIRECAFSGCNKLTEVQLPGKLKILGTWAFLNCASLQKVTIPTDVVEVPMFYDGWLTYVTESPFVSCSKLKEVTLADGMQKVAGSLFKNCASLEKILIPDSVIEIGENAFANASSLQEIVLSKNLTHIGTKAFVNCSLLEKIELPDTVKSMGSFVFENCRLLLEVKLPKFKIEISSGTFKNCTSLKRIDFPEGLQYIFNNAFEGCDKLERIVLPDGFKGIENAVFKDCKRLASVELKGDYIGDFAFENCMELAEVKMQDSIYSIGSSAFLNCTNIADIHISTGLKRIAANVFEGCTFLDNIVIPYGVTDIGDEAFKNCSNLKNISIPENVTKISDKAFSYPEKTTVYGVKGSYAEEYAKDRNMIFSVNETAVESINFLKESYMVREGQTIKAAVSILPQNANTTLIWTSSDESIATVASGTVRGVGTGECSITAKVGKVEVSCKVRVKDGLYGINITGKSTLQVGNTQQLICMNGDGEAMEAKEFRWWSNNPNVAVVDQEGKVQALKKGRVKIEAWLLENIDMRSTLEIEVTEKGGGNEHTHSYQSQVTTQPSCTKAGVKTYICSECGDSYVEKIPAAGHKYTKETQNPTCTAKGVITYTCSVCKHSYSKKIAATGKHSWSSYVTTKRATVFAAGTKTRTCSVCGKKDTVTVGKLPATIKLNAKSITLKVKQSTTKVKVSGLAAGDKVKSWKSSNTKIVKVTKAGKITAQKKTGKATLTIILKSGKKATIKVKVQKGAVKTTKISGLPKKLKLKVKQKHTLKPVLSPLTSVQKVTYSSANKRIATVDGKGKVTAKKAGKTTITVKSGNKKYRIAVSVWR